MMNLLNSILKLELSEGDWLSEGKMIKYSYLGANNELIKDEINVYEFAYMCKIWAHVRGYNIISYTISKGEFDVFVVNAEINDFNESLWSSYHLGSEPEAIIKACEWILKETNGN